MGIDRFSLADALLGILAQRLARRLCNRAGRLISRPRTKSGTCSSEYCDEVAHTQEWQATRRLLQSACTQDWLQQLRQGWPLHTLSRAQL
jgi:type II secretory ATPase GspE/PulE/Tfp pilus assembly ATPase PilB-like protein